MNYKELKKYIKQLESTLIAFSGGVDSTFLAKIAKEALGNNAKAVTVDTPYMPRWEIEEAMRMAEYIGIKHETVSLNIDESVAYNPPDRCYRCKKYIFQQISRMANEQGYRSVIDGSNADDIQDYRPGLRALKELGIRSPLLEKGITKSQIREMSRQLGLLTWDKPAYACLLTRLPHDQKVELRDLQMVETAERYLISSGFRSVRVRKHQDVARIEVDPADISRMFNKQLMGNINHALIDIGFKYVALDMQGYRTGSLNRKQTKEVIHEY